MYIKQCIIIRSSDRFPNRHICIDVDNAEEVTSVIFKDEKYKNKFEYICGRILENSNMYYDDYVRLENYSNIKITEMRFFPNGDNARVYCMEATLNGNQFCIIMAAALPKKKPSGKIDKAIKQFIDAIKNYKYELQQ